MNEPDSSPIVADINRRIDPASEAVSASDFVKVRSRSANTSSGLNDAMHLIVGRDFLELDEVARSEVWMIAACTGKLWQLGH